MQWIEWITFDFSVTDAVCTVRVLGPDADATTGVEDEIAGTGEVVGLTVNARQDHVAHVPVAVFKETVLARAITKRLGGL